MSLYDEETLIGELLNRPDLLPDAQSVVSLGDFENPSTARAFEWLADAKLSTNGADNVRDFLKWAKRECLTWKAPADESSVAGLRRIAEVTTGAHVVYHAKRIANEAAWHRIAGVATQLGELLRDRDPEGLDDSERALNVASERISDALTRSARGQAVHIASILPEALREIESRLAGQSRIGLETGFVGLDRMLSGLRPGQLVILAARPGQGKSALAANMAANVCEKIGGRVLFVSLEMSRDELVERMLASHAGIDCGRMRQGNMNAKERAAVSEAGGELTRWELSIDDRSDLRVNDIIAQARRMQMRGGLDLLVIDYLQLLRADNPRDPRQEQVAKFSRGLKQAAKSLQIPVLCLAQLNREADQPNERPRLSHLRESGAIEQDADVVMFIWHEPTMGGKPEHGQPVPCKVLVAKQRNGPTGEIEMEWRGDVVTFTERAKQAERFGLPDRVEPVRLNEESPEE